MNAIATNYPVGVPSNLGMRDPIWYNVKKYDGEIKDVSDRKSNEGSNRHSDGSIPAPATMQQEENNDGEDIASKSDRQRQASMKRQTQVRSYTSAATRATTKPKNGNLEDASRHRYFLAVRSQYRPMRRKTARNIQLNIRSKLCKVCFLPLKSHAPRRPVEK